MVHKPRGCGAHDPPRQPGSGTVVVVNSGSAVTMPWANGVRGIIENWYPGQEDGTAIARLLHGDVNFPGKPPVPLPQSLNDIPAHTTPQWPGQNNTVQHTEGRNIGYRWYDSQNKTPLHPFGYKLSSTTFDYPALTVCQPDTNGNVTAAFDIQNTGTKTGTEITQAYPGQPATTGKPPKNLRDLQRATRNPGRTRHITLTLNARSLQYWNNGRTNATGTDTVSTGSSSRDIRLTGTTTIPTSGGMTPPGQTTPITLRAHANNQYVTAENAGAAALIANRTAIGPWEKSDPIHD
ncbi:glycoside hydrolase family 3 C-terminal domain-containing protein [Actinacidiphila sp. ITFR-21]|uniref:glycoside hydrolase family 3 C-terminal domain-containing protein n=1 Tax=Actinacidiphila sp. ITFR-21 TaxID=3075199 RepID=UPI00288A079B|nr:glycoside hydrolase family 3 C-terminal domain-containing protein [Streptomyces sp. ITFR-21]WNI19515.1 glycoside hydrolase family 3 C-terminal domain-containing protein [Streptomyces sp. ITFR-21]